MKIAGKNNGVEEGMLGFTFPGVESMVKYAIIKHISEIKMG